MKFEIGISSSSKLILLDGTCEEDNGFMETYSYLFHLIVISDNPWCVGSIQKVILVLVMKYMEEGESFFNKYVILTDLVNMRLIYFSNSLSFYANLSSISETSTSR